MRPKASIVCKFPTFTNGSFGSISEYCLSENQSRRSSAIQRIAELMKLNFWSENSPFSCLEPRCQAYPYPSLTFPFCTLTGCYKGCYGASIASFSASHQSQGSPQLIATR